MKNRNPFIITLFILLFCGEGLFGQSIELIYYDLDMPCKVLTKKKNFIICNKSEAWKTLDCDLSEFNFLKYTVIGVVRTTCGHEGELVLKIIEDNENKKYIIKTRFQKPCNCRLLKIPNPIRIVYTKSFRDDYMVEFR